MSDDLFKVCPECGGRGGVACSDCEGGMVAPSCPECDGSGHVFDPETGEGHVCEQCEGEGRVADPDECPMCQGDKTIECEACGGAGEMLTD